MEKYIGFLIVSVINFVECQKHGGMTNKQSPDFVPDKCRLNDAMYKQCCILPPFFTRDVARECGAKLTVNEMRDDVGVITVRRHMFDKCEFWVCVLNKYDLFTTSRGIATEFVDDNKYFAHLDRWVDLNPNFADAITKAKIRCKDYYKLFIPLKKCEFYTFQQCLRNFVTLHCPTQAVVPTKECEDLMKFYDECKIYYVI